MCAHLSSCWRCPTNRPTRRMLWSVSKHKMIVTFYVFESLPFVRVFNCSLLQLVRPSGNSWRGADRLCLCFRQPRSVSLVTHKKEKKSRYTLSRSILFFVHVFQNELTITSLWFRCQLLFLHLSIYLLNLTVYHVIFTGRTPLSSSRPTVWSTATVTRRRRCITGSVCCRNQKETPG